MEAMIGLLSAVGVVIIQRLADFIMARVNRKDQKADKKEEKNDKIMEKFNAIEKDLSEIKEAQKTLSREVKDNRAVESRIRILRFEDEMQHGQKHSEDHFKQIVEDIDTYREYCDAHPDFHNGIGHCASDHILAVYRKLSDEHKFLMEEHHEKKE